MVTIPGALRGAAPWQRNLFVVLLAQAVTVMGFSFVFPFVPLYVQELGVEGPARAALWSGIAGSAMGLSLFVTGPVWGIVGDRYGRKANMLRALFGSAVLTAATAFVPTVEGLVVMRFLTGMVSGVFATSLALVASQTPRERMGFSMGLLQMATFLGNTIGPIVGGALGDAIGFRQTFSVAGAVRGACGLLVLLLVHEEFHRPRDLDGRRPLGFLRDFAHMATSRQVLPVLALLFVVQVTPVIMFPVLPVFIQSLSAGITSGTATGLAFATLGVSSALSALVVARVADRWGPRRIMVSCALLAGVFHLPALAVQTVWQVIPLVALLGLFNGGMLATTNTLVGVAVPREQHGRAFGAVQSANSLAFGMGPLVGGALATAIGLRQVFLVNGLAFLLTGLVAHRLLARREGAHQAEQAARRATV